MKYTLEGLITLVWAWLAFRSCECHNITWRLFFRWQLIFLALDSPPLFNYLALHIQRCGSQFLRTCSVGIAKEWLVEPCGLGDLVIPVLYSTWGQAKCRILVASSRKPHHGRSHISGAMSSQIEILKNVF